MRKIVLVGVILALCLIVGLVSWNFYSSEKKQEIQLVRCIDGDTAKFRIQGKEEKVRFLGVDAPEMSHPGGEEASKYTCDMLEKAKRIEIEYDDNSDIYDKYDRVLGWIFVDNHNLSELLLSKGYAEVKYVYGNYKYIEELCESQDKAYQQRVGIWEVRYDQYDDNYCRKIIKKGEK